MVFWVDSLSVGIPSLDADHLVFLQLCDAYRAAQAESDAATAAAAEAIMRHTLAHLSHEESVLVEAGYARAHPGPFMVHVGEHLQLKSRIYAVLEKHGNANDLIALLVQHLLKHDMKFKAYLQAAAGN